MITHWY